jgi:hypothetical protein
MGKFAEWVLNEEGHITLDAYDKHAANKKVFTAKAKSDDEVKAHLRALHDHVVRTGRTHHVLVYNKKTFEHESHTIKAHNPLGRKYDS